MLTRTKAALAVAGATAVIAAGAGAALADGGHPGGPPGSGAIASYLGLTPAQLQTQLESGKTPAQIAQAQGKSVTGLEDAIYADAKSHLDAEVAAGTLTAAQEEHRLADLKSHLDDIVNHSRPPADRRGPGGPPFAAVAAYLGITADELRTELLSGETLAQVATAHGKAVAGLEDAIYADARSHLDADVAAGRITAAQEQQRLGGLKAHLDDIVNHTGPPARP